MTWALVDEKGNVVNVIVYDGVSEYQAPNGLTLVEVQTAKIGQNLAEAEQNNVQE